MAEGKTEDLVKKEATALCVPLYYKM